MRSLSENALKKIEIIKKAILFGGQLLSKIDKRHITIELLDYDHMNEDNFYELVFEVKIEFYECDDCSIDMNYMSNTLQEVKNLVEGSSNFRVKPNLNIAHGNSTRGVLLQSFDYAYDELYRLEFNIFINPD